MSTATLTFGPTVVRADDDPLRLAAYAALRRRTFVAQQGLFAGGDEDSYDGQEATRVLVALDDDGEVLGGVRLHPVGDDSGLGWWRGSRLVCVSRGAERRGLVGAALVRAACAQAVAGGALRFDAHVQEPHVRFFARLGWHAVQALEVCGAPHRLMRWPIDRIAALGRATKAALGELWSEALATPSGFLGDDGTPVPGARAVACVDGILPRMVEGDPEWAGWCGMLVTAHDLSAMGARFVGALDALGARDAAHAARVARGLRDGAEAFGLPLLGGHTQLGVPGSLSVTGLGVTDDPVPAAGGRPGDALRLTADLAGHWRPGYGRTQWDSSTARHASELAAMFGAVGIARPHAAKDVSMAGIVGTVGMLAEASGCGAEVEVASIPRPDGVEAGDWLTCFPGFAMVSADAPATQPLSAGPAAQAVCGRLTRTPGVRLRWPDGALTTALAGPVTGLGPARTLPEGGSCLS